MALRRPLDRRLISADAALARCCRPVGKRAVATTLNSRPRKTLDWKTPPKHSTSN